MLIGCCLCLYWFPNQVHDIVDCCQLDMLAEYFRTEIWMKIICQLRWRLVVFFSKTNWRHTIAPLTPLGSLRFPINYPIIDWNSLRTILIFPQQPLCLNKSAFFRFQEGWLPKPQQIWVLNTHPSAKRIWKRTFRYNWHRLRKKTSEQTAVTDGKALHPCYGYYSWYHGAPSSFPGVRCKLIYGTSQESPMTHCWCERSDTSWLLHLRVDYEPAFTQRRNEY